MVNIKDTSGFHSCGGVIIDARHILTAKHCIDLTSSSVEQFISGHKFYLGDYDQTSADGEQIIDIERVVFKNASSDAISDDIALLRTKQPMEFRLTRDRYASVNRICLPEGEIFKLQYNRRVTVTGWGRMEANKRPTKLRKADVFIKECPIEVGLKSSTRYTLCATADSDKGSSRGDSGGPLVVRSSASGQFVLAGIVQGGIGSWAGKVGFYANVYSHLEWINKYLE